VEVDMKRMWIGVVALAGLIGCGSSTVSHYWISSDVQIDAPNGPSCGTPDYYTPSPSSIFFDVTNFNFDDMDISVVSSTQACNGSSGYGKVIASANGTYSGSTGSLPAGAYTLAITCYNNDGSDCSPLLHDFGYEN
jgi:hypothetical protein